MSLVLPSVQAREGTESRDRHSDEARMYLQYTSHGWDVTMSPSLSLSHTHTHTHTRHAKLCIWAVNSKHLNYWENKLAVADSEAPDCHSKVRITSSPRFMKRSSIKCVEITSGLRCCCKLSQWFLNSSTFGRPNKVILLLHRNTTSPCHGCINTTAVTETTSSFFAWTFGLHYANIYTLLRRRGGVFEWAVLGGRGRVLTLIKNISLVLRF